MTLLPNWGLCAPRFQFHGSEDGVSEARAEEEFACTTESDVPALEPITEDVG